MITPERAKQIIQAAKDKAIHGPWSDQLDKVLLTGERDYIISVWDKMDGSTCFVDALYRVVNGNV